MHCAADGDRTALTHGGASRRPARPTPVIAVMAPARAVGDGLSAVRACMCTRDLVNGVVPPYVDVR
jgi:hypothetical protein